MPQFNRYIVLLALLSGVLNYAAISGQGLTLSSSPANCYADKSGVILAKLTTGLAPYVFILSVDSLRKTEIKRSPILQESSFSFKEISAGKYYITAICGNGQEYTQYTVIDQPSQLRPGKISVESYPGSSSEINGILQANPIGGTPPYSFTWQGAGVKGNDQKISGVGNGIYKCSIKDSHGCGPVSATIFLGSKAKQLSNSIYNGNQDKTIFECRAHLFKS